MICQLKSQTGREVRTLCGVVVEIPRDERVDSRVSFWPNRVSCPECRQHPGVSG